MTYGRNRYSVLPAVCLVALFACPLPGRADEAPLTREQMAEFLRTAEVIGSKGTSKGVTRPRRLTLSDGRITHDALFQVVDEEKSVQRFQGGRVEINWRDSWMFNVAAYRLAEMLGIGDMVPVTVERTHQSARGALTWWIDNVKFDEQGRRKSGEEPPDRIAWSQQVQTSRVFTELVYDTDRNMGNQLVDDQWRLWMVDFTRAFRRHDFLKAPNTLAQCSRTLRDRLQALTKGEVTTALGEYLRPAEIDALMRRRDLILERFEKLAAARGEETVYF
jgi:hypothetical protein